MIPSSKTMTKTDLLITYNSVTNIVILLFISLLNMFDCLFVMLSCLLIAALWSLARKGLTSLLSWICGSLVFCHFTMWCPGSGVVLDCIDSCSLPYSLLCYSNASIITRIVSNARLINRQNKTMRT